MRVKFKDLIGRITGISVPVFGVSWQPPELERKVVRDVLVFLEDRRALYNAFAHEIEDQVSESVVQIRSELTNAIRRVSDTSKAAASFRAMRAACRQYLNDTQARHSPRFFGSMVELGRLRATFGIHVAYLGLQYGIDVEGDLAAILPPAPSHEDETEGNANDSFESDGVDRRQ